VAVDALIAARARHAFVGMNKSGQSAIFETLGNHDCHIILRGGKAPNYDKDSVEAACRLLHSAGLNEKIMIDVSHANSSKDHLKQIAVTQAVCEQISQGSKALMGVMIESHLNEGRQQQVTGAPLARGVSITDPCISFSQTRILLRDLASAFYSRKTRLN